VDAGIARFVHLTEIHRSGHTLLPVGEILFGAARRQASLSQRYASAQDEPLLVVVRGLSKLTVPFGPQPTPEGRAEWHSRSSSSTKTGRPQAAAFFPGRARVWAARLDWEQIMRKVCQPCAVARRMASQDLVDDF